MSKRKLKESGSTKARVFRANQHCKDLDKAVVKAVKESEKPRHPVKRKLTIPKHTEDTTTKKKKSSDKGNKWARQAAVKGLKGLKEEVANAKKVTEELVRLSDKCILNL
ncbi:hypothetical protein NW754_014396 [Fusarium falciforme]|nr:hypothetical protein NW754_014396 [Fusarium falciforme]